MATATGNNIDRIGDVAGDVWNCLSNHGSMSISQLVKSVEAPRDLVMQAVGWLARENKIDITEGVRGRLIALKDSGL